MPRQYPESFKRRAVRMVLDRLEDEDAPSRYTVIRQTAPTIGIAVETLRRWVAHSESKTAEETPVTEDALAEILMLKRDNAELRRANEILKTASAFFAAELDRPSLR